MAEARTRTIGAAACSPAAANLPKGELDSKFLMRLARYTLTSDEQSQLGVFLDMDRSTVRDIIRNSEGAVTCTFDILEAWRCGLNVPSTTAMYEQLYGAYMDVKRTDVAECIRSEQLRLMKHELHQVEEECETVKEELRTNSGIRTLKNELHQVEEELERVKEELQTSNEQVHHLSDQLKKARKTNQSGKQKSNEQMRLMKMELRKMEDKSRTSSEQVHLLSDQLKKAEEANQSCRQQSDEQIRLMKTELHEVEDELGRVKEELQTSNVSGAAHHECEMEKYKIAELLKTPLKKGDTWYLIDAKWFKQWKKYVGFDAWDAGSVGDETVFPGPIDNTPLCKEGTKNTLKEHLRDELDYNLMPDDAWKKLVTWYGIVNTDMVLSRKVLEQGMFVKHCAVEVYLMELKLCHNQDLEHVVTEQFSKADTIECIEKKMQQAFNISDKTEVRLWNKYMSNTYEHLSRSDLTIQDAGLYQGTVIVIEERNADGTWPRQTSVTSSYSSPGVKANKKFK